MAYFSMLPRPWDWSTYIQSHKIGNMIWVSASAKLGECCLPRARDEFIQNLHYMVFYFIKPLLVTVNHCVELCWEPEMNSYTRQAVGGKWQEESIREVDILGPSPLSYPIQWGQILSQGTFSHTKSSWANFNHGLVEHPQGCQGCQKIQKNIL